MTYTTHFILVYSQVRGFFYRLKLSLTWTGECTGKGVNNKSNCRDVEFFGMIVAILHYHFRKLFLCHFFRTQKNTSLRWASLSALMASTTPSI